MDGPGSLASLVAARTDRALEVALLETSDPGVVAAELTAFIEAHLGVIERVHFYRGGTGIVAGLGVAGVGDVVIKIHRRTVDEAGVRMAQRVQRHLAESGYPTPRPLLKPTPIGLGFATADVFVGTERVDGHDPTIRNEVAARLQEFIAVATNSVDISGLPSPTQRSGLWGEPHDLRFDFEATSDGAEWIDVIAADAQRQLRKSTLPDVIAHFDWRIENLAFRNNGIVGVFDWDSVGTAPEAVAVGQCSAQFSTDWTVGHSTLPTIEEMSAFVDDYESARGSRLTDEERSVAEAANLMVIAYSARCEHSDRTLHPELVPSTDTWADLLSLRSARRLGT